jgi:deaminated glutathione amidase
MRIALAQLLATTDPDANLGAVRELTNQAAAQGAELVVFPEATMCSFARPRADAAEPFDGPWVNAVREIAANHAITIVVGMFTTTDSALVHNTLLVTGNAEARYDKLHLFDALGYAESRQIQAGDMAVNFKLSSHSFGLATCYDVRFPHLFTHLASQGAEAILLPASWADGPEKLHQWRTLVTARAMDATAFVVAVDQARPPLAEDGRTPTGIGHSMVAGPTGTVLLELGDGPELAVIDLDLGSVAATRERLPVLRHARPELW